MMLKLTQPRDWIQFIFNQFIIYEIGQKSVCPIESYQEMGTTCYSCSFKCQMCNSWNNCSKCQPGYNLFNTADGRTICIKTCKTLWVKDSTNGNSYLQGFYLHEGKCVPCLKGCLNCIDIDQCYECGNYKTGITTQESTDCLNYVQNSCPLGTGYEQRVKRCLDCSYSTQKFYSTTTPKPIDPLICDPKNIYDALTCPLGSIFAKGTCINNSNISTSISLESFQAIVQKGCLSIAITYPFKCIKCSPFYYFTAGPICVSRYNKGIGNCEYDQSVNKCPKCSYNDDFDHKEITTDDKQYDIDDFDPTEECKIKTIIKQRYSYNISQPICTQFQGFMFPPNNTSSNQVCLTTCPSSIDDQGQYSNYYTQWKSIIYDIQSKTPIITVSCVQYCDDGFAVDEENRLCYECSTVSNCSRCSLNDLNVCIACKSGYFLTDNGNCDSTCNQQVVVVNNVQHCLACKINNCISCSSATQCNKCNNNATPSSNCTQCAAGYHKDWKLSDQCIICSTQYNLFYLDQSGVCHETCGKGLRFTDELQCDDGNLNNGDGCDSKCKIEYKWKCLGGHERSRDYCYKNDIDEAIKDNTDVQFSFSIKFNAPKNSQPYVSILFTQQPVLKAGIPLKDIFTIRISSLSQEEYSYDIVPISKRNRQLQKTKYNFQKNSQQNALQEYSNRSLYEQYGFYVYLQLNSTLRNQEVIVFVNQTSIKNKDGNILYKNSDIAEIKKYILVSESELKQSQQTNTIAQSTQGAVLFSGISLAIINNIYSLMAVVDITEIIYYFLYLDIEYPQIVSSFFEQFDNFQLPFLPNPFDQYLNDVEQQCHPHVMELDTDSLFMRNSGTNIFTIAIFAGLYIFCKIIQLLFNRFTKFTKLKNFLNKCVHKLQYEYSLEVIYVVFLNFAASCFLQLQDTSIGESTEKEHTAELINMFIFSFSFAACFIIPTSFFILLYKNKRIIEFNPDLYQYNLQENQQEESPKINSLKAAAQNNFAKEQQQLNQNLENKSQIQANNFDEEFQQEKFVNTQLNKKSTENDHILKINDTNEKENQDHQIEEQSLRRQKLEKEHEEFMEKWGTLMIGCKTSDFKLYIYNVITYYRKMIMMAIIMCMMDYAELQLLLLVIHHILVTVYIIKYMPFEKFAQNVINAISEILFILLEVFVMRLTSASVNQSDEDERRHIGVWIIAFFLSIIVIHILLMIYELVHDIYELILKKIKKRTNKVNSTVCIIKKDTHHYKNKKISILDNDFVSIPPTVNNSLILNKYDKNNVKENINAKLSKNDEQKANQEPRNIQLMDSFALSIRTPKNQNKQQKIAIEKIKLTNKDTSPLSEEGTQAINKKGSFDEEEDDYQFGHNIQTGTITLNSNTLPTANYRRRSTRTQDQTPFHLKSSRLSLVFKKESLPSSSIQIEEIKSNLKIPSLEEVHESSNSPSSKNDIDSIKNYPNSNQQLSYQNSQINTPGRESSQQLKSDSPENQEKHRFINNRAKNKSRLSIFNNKQENQASLSLNESPSS